MPARGDNAQGVFEMGSTATRVVHSAPCPILVLEDGEED